MNSENVGAIVISILALILISVFAKDLASARQNMRDWIGGREVQSVERKTK